MTTTSQIIEVPLFGARNVRLLKAKSASKKFTKTNQKRITLKQIKKHKLKELKKKKQTERQIDRETHDTSIQENTDQRLGYTYEICDYCRQDMNFVKCSCFEYNNLCTQNSYKFNHINYNRFPVFDPCGGYQMPVQCECEWE
jgi:hypothetical protein